MPNKDTPQLYEQLRFVRRMVTDCYICGQPLNGEKSSDHVIPNKIFAVGSPDRPQLPTHHGCNNGKSMDDEWFMRQLQKMCSLNPRAKAGLDKLLNKALAEKQSADMIGKSNQIRNYKLARTILQNDKWGSKTALSGRRLSTLSVASEDVRHIMEYMKRVCRGLYLLNVPNAQPALPEITGVQYAGAIANHTYDAFMDPVSMLLQQSKDSQFSQAWSDQVFYIGSSVTGDINKGFIFIEFYKEAGFLAMFQ